MIPPAGTYLSPRTALHVLSSALVQQLVLKHRARTMIVGSTAELRAVPTRALDAQGGIPREVVFVRERDLSFWWDRFATGADDDAALLRPADVPMDFGGRWRATPFRDLDRQWWLQRVHLCHAGLRTKDLLELCEGQLPALFLSFTGDSPEEQSQIPGTLFWNNYGFRLRAISANWRGEPAAELGSPEPSEAAQDPGVDDILGAASWFLSKYNTLNDTLGVSRMMIGRTAPLEVWGTERRAVSALDFTIHASLYVPNEIQDLRRPTRVLAQRQVQDQQGAWQNLGAPDEVPL